ncbi:MAG: hypothetical protein EA379_12105, partial [Phycisphaerales bacterium]
PRFDAADLNNDGVIDQRDVESLLRGMEAARRADAGGGARPAAAGPSASSPTEAMRATGPALPRSARASPRVGGGTSGQNLQKTA